MRHLYVLIVVSCLAIECHPSRKGSYNCAYDLVTEFTTYGKKKEGSSTFKGVDPFYFYNGALIELVLKQVNETTVTEKYERTETHYDTIGVLFIDPGKQKYVQFDSFYFGARVVSQGLYKDAPIGIKLSDFSFKPNEREKRGGFSFKDTVINKNALKFDRMSIKGAGGRDSAAFYMYYFNDPSLFTPFMIQGFKLPGSSMVLAGFEYLSYVAGQKMLQLVENRRPMSSYELSVCKQIELEARAILK